MLRQRLPAAPRQSRRTPPELPAGPPGPDSPTPSARDLLFRSRPGRLFLVAASLKLVLGGLRQLVDVPWPIDLLSSVATIGLAVSVGYFVWRLFLLTKRRLLWRVRRKLILSYIFIGVVPALLILGFVTLGALIISMNVSSYLFRDGYDDIVAYANLAANAAASEIARTPASTPDTIGRVQRSAARLYRSLSMEFVPSPGAAAPPMVRAGEWAHVSRAPDRIPIWVTERTGGFTGTIVSTATGTHDVYLIVRAAVPAIVGSRSIGYVIVDVPVDDEIFATLYETTAVKAGRVGMGGDTEPLPAVSPDGTGANDYALFDRGVTVLDALDWDTGQPHRATIAYSYTISELYEKLSEAQPAQVGTGSGTLTWGRAILAILVLVAVLFLIIQIVALVMGLALARSITSSIHELFMGTERVRHGDFAHRIDVVSSDQLGELAGSFNQMIGSIENLLQTAAEKKRLEEELRIARQIQMSLLPRGTLDMPGLAVTALCVPAREVGGDYYDFFPLPDEKLGVLIADVSGKGTSAALYMAELKGLILSLSQIYLSPRQLLLETNRIISENLDSRSFITMTYAVLDLRAGTMTYARAGHTPLIHLRSAPGPASGVHILVPNGMVLGLDIPGAPEKFAELLEEDRLELGTGDVIVLYTDGITEAMNENSDLFGDARLSQIVEEHGHLESGELRERILREIEAFVGSADQHDDMTMILMKIEARMPARLGLAASVAVSERPAGEPVLS